MAEVSSYEAKTHLPRLLRRVARGERITITRHGVPVAELIPFGGPVPTPIADRRAAIEKLKKFSRRHKLGRLTIRQLIEEGRRF